MQRNKQMAIGRKKFNMDPRKVRARLFLVGRGRDWEPGLSSEWTIWIFLRASAS